MKRILYFIFLFIISVSYAYADISTLEKIIKENNYIQASKMLIDSKPSNKNEEIYFLYLELLIL